MYVLMASFTCAIPNYTHFYNLFFSDHPPDESAPASPSDERERPCQKASHATTSCTPTSPPTHAPSHVAWKKSLRKGEGRGGGGGGDGGGEDGTVGDKSDSEAEGIAAPGSRSTH
jgi:hypothetical protein